MRVLLTNDDGYKSRGIVALREALHAHDHSVWMFAPHENMSACSHSITTKRPLRIRPLRDEQTFSCNGTPSDCVILALRGVFDVDFDCVVSGINVGPNLGDDIIFSGTVAAARQAVLMGTPALALSLFDEEHPTPHLFSIAAKRIVSHLGALLSLADKDHLVNINVPNIDAEMKYVYAAPSQRLYEDNFSSFSPPNSTERFYFMSASPHNVNPKVGTDWAVVKDGNIAVSIIHVHPTNKLMRDNHDIATQLSHINDSA